jgi:hypothetical protein
MCFCSVQWLALDMRLECGKNTRPRGAKNEKAALYRKFGGVTG